MALNLSLLGKSCLVIAAEGYLRQLIVTALHQVGLPNVTKATDIEAAIYELSQSDYDVVLCAETEFGTSVTTVKRIRKDCPGRAAEVPVVCLTDNMDPEHLSKLMGAGVNAVMTQPIGTRSLLKSLNRALTDNREFIRHESFRGPCRRARISNSKYHGPRRRLSDLQNASPHRKPAPPEERQANSASLHVRGASNAQRSLPPGMEDAQSLSAREQTLLNGVHEIASSLDRLKQGMKSAESAANRRLMRESLNDAAHRLVNLLMLADMNDQQNGTGENRLRLMVESTKGKFIDVLTGIASHELGTIIGEIDSHTNANEPALGHSEALSARLAGVEEIVVVIGGPKKLGDEMKKSLRRAWGEVLRLQEIEGRVFNIKDLSNIKNTTKPKRNIKSIFTDDDLHTAASQEDVLRSLKDNK
jgi:CheY-like chemotaxis protein